MTVNLNKVSKIYCSQRERTPLLTACSSSFARQWIAVAAETDGKAIEFGDRLQFGISAPSAIVMADTALHFGYVAQTIINSIDVDDFEEGIEKLRAFIPDTTLVAALDVVDRDRVLRYKTPWGRSHYEVFGSTLLSFSGNLSA
ncbi:hypothetical protein EV401DRAFT_1882601 [Pisolithus croceorrhizus]|nr:hypothetical protein EV401DRAFT_1882601 [Pisolithus croceorrhizus]